MSRRTFAYIWIAAAGVVGFTPAAVRAQAPTRTTWSGVFTAAQAERGKQVYLATCARCHGTNLEGEEIVPPLTGGRFTSSWNGLTLGDLYERIRTTMPYDDPGILKRPEISDVIAYILKQSSFPAGARELAQRGEALKLIAFEATRASR
jgi:mono/diheme cytochrome c family protein